MLLTVVLGKYRIKLMISVEFFLAVFFGWLVFITWLLLKTRAHYFRLVDTTKKIKIDEVLDFLLAEQKKEKEKIELIKKTLEEEINRSKIYLQKINLIRYQPFERGEDSSFVITFLDGENNGLVMNFLYTKEGLRVYTKKVFQGKGKDYPLTEEEEKAVKSAKNI